MQNHVAADAEDSDIMKTIDECEGGYSPGFAKEGDKQFEISSNGRKPLNFFYAAIPPHKYGHDTLPGCHEINVEEFT